MKVRQRGHGQFGLAAILGAVLALLGVGVAQGQAPSASSASSASAPASSSAPAVSSGPEPELTPDGGTTDVGSVYSSCVEHIPEGATKPRMTEKFPVGGLAGYALPLEVEVEHGAGETVLPQGFSLQLRGVEAESLQKSGFMVPSLDGGAPPSLSPMSLDGGVKTKVVIHVVALPKRAGRHEMELPPLPIAVARASGEMMTLCTSPHRVVIDDPTGNTPDARPRPNPPARRQREHWEALERGVQFGLVALVAAIVGALVYRWWRKRPRPVPPPPPPRPPWEVALEALYLLRDSKALQEGQQEEYAATVSDILRKYLGDRYGFDGLEATSREIRKALRAVTPPPPVLTEVERLLDESDLIKFAGVTPTTEECEALFSLGETIVKATIPERPLMESSKKEGP